MSATTQKPAPAVRSNRLRNLFSGSFWAVSERGARVLVGNNIQTVVSGFFEPVLYLLSMGLGMGALIGPITYHGHEVSYFAFIAPALLATSAMNGAFFEATRNVFHRMKYAHLYETMLQTRLGPLDVAVGEIGLPMMRSAVYSIGFLIIMAVFGLVAGSTALLLIPATLLIGLAFASIGFMITTFMKSWQQFDALDFLVLPMFLLSATFFPITVFAEPIQWFIQALPLYHGVELCRMLATGIITSQIWVHIGYFLAMIAVGVPITTRRLGVLFLK